MDLYNSTNRQNFENIFSSKSYFINFLCCKKATKELKYIKNKLCSKCSKERLTTTKMLFRGIYLETC